MHARFVFRPDKVTRSTGRVEAQRLPHNKNQRTKFRATSPRRIFSQGGRLTVKNRSLKTWSLDEKIRVLGEAAKVNGAELTALLARECLGLAQLEQWRLLPTDEASGSFAPNRRIRNL
jgi:hypothetical protein